MKSLKNKAKKIKLLLLDVDGVLTDGRIIYSEKGDECKEFSISDGLGVVLFKRTGLKCAIVTAKDSKIVRKRAKVLGIDKVYGDYHYKIKALPLILRDFKVRKDEICFLGDELIDIPLLKRVGLSVGVRNSCKEVRKVVDYITKKSGGNGAVREVVEILLKSQNKWKKVIARYFE